MKYIEIEGDFKFEIEGSVEEIASLYEKLCIIDNKEFSEN